MQYVYFISFTALHNGTTFFSNTLIKTDEPIRSANDIGNVEDVVQDTLKEGTKDLTILAICPLGKEKE